MRLLLIGIFSSFLLSANPAFAATQFPYEAAVKAKSVEVRSGPGRAYYATGEVRQNQKVRVHRHDPGGWFMIAPPSGSFSYVRAEYVNVINQQQGQVTHNQVIVRVGSSVNDGREVEQRRLMKGDQVRILGQKSFSIGGKRVDMLLIEPPAGEYRWVKGDYIVPVDQANRQSHDQDPYKVPSDYDPTTFEGFDDGPIAQHDDKFDKTKPCLDTVSQNDDSKPTTTTTNYPGTEAPTDVISTVGLGSKKLERDREILKALDDNFRAMIQEDIETWRLADLDHDYRKLHSEVSSEPLKHQVDLRLAAVEKYQKIQKEHDDFKSITQATVERDRQLVAAQHQIIGQDGYSTVQTSNSLMVAQDGITVEAPPILEQGPTTSVTAPGPSLEPTHPPQPGVVQPAPAEPRTGQTPAADNQARGLQLSGAGIVQRTGWRGNNVPTHMLRSPQGQVLAYLYAGPGIQLDRYLGQSVGLYGRRQHSPQLRADVIVVQGATPVRLMP